MLKSIVFISSRSVPYNTKRYKIWKSFSEGLNLKKDEVDEETFLAAAKLCGVDYKCYEDYANDDYSAYFDDWVNEYIDNIFLESARKRRRKSKRNNTSDKSDKSDNGNKNKSDGDA